MKNNKEIRQEKLNACKNLFALLVSIMILLVCKHPTVDLQSSLNVDQGLGSISISIGQGASILFLLLLPPFLIGKIGLKMTIMIGFFFQTLYVVANLYPTWLTLISSSVLNYGFNNVGRVAQITLLTIYSKRLSNVFDVSFEKVLSIGFGLMTGLAGLGNVIGSVISFEVLNVGADLTLNVSRESRQNCGVYFVENSDHLSGQFAKPSAVTIYVLFGVLALCGFSSLILIWFMADATPRKGGKVQLSLFVKVLALNKDWKALALFMINFHIGLVEAFVSSEFNKAFVTCILGMQYVGLSSITYGISNIISGFATGFLVKRHGRFLAIGFAMAVELTALLHALYWHPGLENDYLNVFLLSLLWGIVYSNLRILSQVLHGVLYSADDLETTYANCLLSESCGLMVGNGFSSSLPLDIQVYIHLGVLATSLACYFKLDRLSKE